MPNRASAALAEILRPESDLSKSRLETLCLTVLGMVSARRVTLGHIACERPGPVQTASTYRRLQRFFQHVRLDEDRALPLLIRLPGQHGSWLLALDRTTWQIGKREVNFLVLALVTRRFRVPLIWTVIEGRGCSDTGMRIALIERCLVHFPAKTRSRCARLTAHRPAPPPGPPCFPDNRGAHAGMRGGERWGHVSEPW